MVGKNTSLLIWTFLGVCLLEEHLPTWEIYRSFLRKPCPNFSRSFVCQLPFYWSTFELCGRAFGQWEHRSSVSPLKKIVKLCVTVQYTTNRAENQPRFLDIEHCCHQLLVVKSCGYIFYSCKPKRKTIYCTITWPCYCFKDIGDFLMFFCFQLREAAVSKMNNMKEGKVRKIRYYFCSNILYLDNIRVHHLVYKNN